MDNGSHARRQSTDLPPWPEDLPSPPSPLVTRRIRTLSMCQRARKTPERFGKVKYFCRQRGHGFITPQDGGDDLFVHILDIDGEFVPHEGDLVTYRTSTMPPKFEKEQAVHVTIVDWEAGVHHERWCEAPPPHKHPHPSPNVHQELPAGAPPGCHT